jgi:UDP-glucose 4-epimerase
MKIIILGGSGFLGIHLLEKLLEEKFQVKVLIHDTKINLENDSFHGDVLNPNLLDDILDDNDVVINLVGQMDELSKFVDNNIIGSINILNSCIKKKGIKIFLASSIAVYGNNSPSPSSEDDTPHPTKTYGLVKLITEKIYEHYSFFFGLDVTILRFATLYGPCKKSGFIVELINSIKDGKVNTVFNNGNQFRDLLFIDDAVTGIMQSIKKPQKGFNIFNISSGNKYSLIQIISIIEKLSQKKLHIKLIPDVNDEQYLLADNSKANLILNFIPKTSIETGFSVMLKSFQIT